ncbi:DNA adenine methylase [Haloarcula sp. Atlit-47R]|uniref:DNA adenine methylase n=1 Tax=Haloarcula sp. Atlit-47R TaxID=2282132 RepID=UPI000EF24768|nr:DNA adenine methylase [Haloarcula sp. Atlit-47R]RLM41884.1 DNA adenine methylase [Haloarcula sp. Atlit-47R]
MSKVLPFRWYGGKYSHLTWLLPRLPETEHYIEPFGGSAAVLLNRSPSSIETFNEIDTEVTTFFRVLREQREELLEQIALTPFARSELKNAVAARDQEGTTDLEKARAFFVRAGQTRSGLAQEATPGRWAYCKTTSRREMSGSVSRYYGRLDDLYAVAERLRRVQIENKPALDVIERYDSEDALFYCDPPYPPAARTDTNAYGHEMSTADHRELADHLRSCSGKVAISSYRTDLYDDLFSDWTCLEAPEKTAPTSADQRQEVLYVNYDPVVRDVNIGIEDPARPGDR